MALMQAPSIKAAVPARPARSVPSTAAEDGLLRGRPGPGTGLFSATLLGGLVATRQRVVMRAKTKGKKKQAQERENALKALEAYQKVQQTDAKAQKKPRRGREAKAGARANALQALQAIEEQAQENGAKQENGSQAPKENGTEAPKVEAKEPEKAKEENGTTAPKVEAKEPEKAKEEDGTTAPKVEAKEPEKAKEENGTTAPKVEAKEPEKAKEEDGTTAPKVEAKEPEKAKEVAPEEPEKVLKVDLAEAGKVQENGMETGSQAKRTGVFDVLTSLDAVDWKAKEEDEPEPNPFDTIAEIHKKPRGKEPPPRKELTEEEKQNYYKTKQLQGSEELWARENEPEEEEEEEEDPTPVIRRRGADDQVDFSFLQSGDVEGEVVVGIREVAMRLGGRMVLQDASWTVRTGERLALVGANGCGKTTQLRVLLGQLTPENGDVVRSPGNAKVAILEQSFVDDMNLENTLQEELLAAVPEQKAIRDEKMEVEAKLQQDIPDSEEMESLVNRLMELQEMADNYQVEKVEQTVLAVTKAAGFHDDDLERKVGLFSGGWKVRIGMCKLMMSKPDVILLDEPTNHLDLEAVEWLESYLVNQDLPMVIVTHDREFMNRVCNRVVETVEGMTYSYQGNYTDFIRQKQEKMEKWNKQWNLQEKKRKSLEEYIKKNKGVQSLAQVRKQREKELEDLKENGIDPPPSFVKRIKFRFPEPPKDRRGGAQTEILAELRRVSHGYGDELDEEYNLLEDADFMVTPGDKIGIVGGNGKGKSTLLRLLMGQEQPRDGGQVRPADENMTGFFAQHQADLLPMEKTGWEVIKEANEILMADDKLKEIMKKFRFRGDRAQMKISNLSGGEKARLAIVRMMLMPSRMLIFDEPTNHLDVPMKETLEFALREYEGAVVVVSHDRWFLSQTCKTIVEINDGKVVHYDGDFRFYMDSNMDVRQKIEKHYTGIDGLIESVPASLEERRKKERKGLHKNRAKRRQQERQEVLRSSFLSSRTWRR